MRVSANWIERALPWSKDSQVSLNLRHSLAYSLNWQSGMCKCEGEVEIASYFIFFTLNRNQEGNGSNIVTCVLLIHSKLTLSCKWTMANEIFSNQSEKQTCMTLIIKCKLWHGTVSMSKYFFSIEGRSSQFHYHIKLKIQIILTLSAMWYHDQP